MTAPTAPTMTVPVAPRFAALTVETEPGLFVTLTMDLESCVITGADPLAAVDVHLAGRLATRTEHRDATWFPAPAAL